MDAATEAEPGRFRYVLVTAAHNEERYLPRTVESVIGQSVLPEKWVIVSDGSTDRTDDIVLEYAHQHPFIELLRKKQDHRRDFACKVYALNAGLDVVGKVPCEFIGLDADVTFEPTYFRDLLRKFELNPQLGIRGGSVLESDGKDFRPRGGAALDPCRG